MNLIWLQILVSYHFYGIAFASTSTSDPLAKFFNYSDNVLTQACTSVAESYYDFIINPIEINNTHNFVSALARFQEKLVNVKNYFKQHKVPVIYNNDTIRAALHKLFEKSFYNSEKTDKYYQLYGELLYDYHTLRICEQPNQRTCSQRHSISSLLKLYNSASYDEQLYIWQVFKNATGRQHRSKYVSIVEFENNLIKINYIRDFSIIFPTLFNHKEDKYQVFYLWEKIKPLYTELHKYVMKRLKEHYGNKIDTSDGMIPAHLIGLSAKDHWYHLYPVVQPFESRFYYNWPSSKVYRDIKTFYNSLGFESLNSTTNTDVNMINDPFFCQPTAHDFCNGSYDLTMCSTPSTLTFDEVLIQAREFFRIYYHSQFKDEHFLTRQSPDLGLEEALCNAMALSLYTLPSSNRALFNIMYSGRNNYKENINHLMKIALITVASLPYKLVVDLWKWDVSSSNLKSHEWNSAWWNYRKQYEKIKPPLTRSDEDLDAAPILLLSRDYQYLPLFVTDIMSFQIFKQLCQGAEAFNPEESAFCPLFKCNIADSKIVGNKLKNIMKLGATKHWKKILHMLSGSDNVDPEPMLEYFQPLYEFLLKENNIEKSESDFERNVVKIAIYAVFMTIAGIANVVIIVFWKPVGKIRTQCMNRLKLTVLTLIRSDRRHVPDDGAGEQIQLTDIRPARSDLDDSAEVDITQPGPSRRPEYVHDTSMPSTSTSTSLVSRSARYKPVKTLTDKGYSIRFVEPSPKPKPRSREECYD